MERSRIFFVNYKSKKKKMNRLEPYISKSNVTKAKKCCQLCLGDI